jgi:hypothetical protein
MLIEGKIQKEGGFKKWLSGDLVARDVIGAKVRRRIPDRQKSRVFRQLIIK